MAARPMTGHAEVALPATLGLGLTDPTALTEAVLRGEEGSVAAAGVAVRAPTVVMAMQLHMIKVLRKATWGHTIITSPVRPPKGITTRTATTMRQVPGSTVTLLVVTTRIMAMKVRLRVQFEF